MLRFLWPAANDRHPWRANRSILNLKTNYPAWLLAASISGVGMVFGPTVVRELDQRDGLDLKSAVGKEMVCMATRLLPGCVGLKTKPETSGLGSHLGQPRQ
jgi:hypothetical protein